MRRTKARVAWTLIGLVVPFALAAFATWDINPEHWHPATRFGVGSFAIYLGGMIWNLHPHAPGC